MYTTSGKTIVLLLGTFDGKGGTINIMKDLTFLSLSYKKEKKM